MQALKYGSMVLSASRMIEILGRTDAIDPLVLDPAVATSGVKGSSPAQDGDETNPLILSELRADRSSPEVGQPLSRKVRNEANGKLGEF